MKLLILIAVIVAAAVIGGIFGGELVDSSFSITWAVVGGFGTAASLLGLGAFLEAQERKRKERALAPEFRAVFARMLGRDSPQAPQSDGDAPLALHLPRHLVPPPGHQLKAAVATGDMFTTIDSAREPTDKAAIFITRCFDNAIHCDAREWSMESAREAAEHVFGARIARNKLDELKIIAEEAVRLGYRAATPLDIEVILGTKTDRSWQRDLAILVAKAGRCTHAE